jgi:hypothetical protein
MQPVLLKEYKGYPPDVGCEIASKVNGGLSKCTECPFEKKCIEDIRNQTRQLLKNSEVIEHVFELNKQGKAFCEICELYPKQSPFTIRNWLNHQSKIQKTINQFRWAIPYLK